MSEQSQKLDINIVNPEELMTLQGIGPQLASRIIAARPFSDLEDMRRVEGIGSQTIESLKPFIIFTQPANIEEIHTVESRVNSEIHLESETSTGEEAEQVEEDQSEMASISSVDEEAVAPTEPSVEDAVAIQKEQPDLKSKEQASVHSKPTKGTNTHLEKYPKSGVTRGEVWLMVIGSCALAIILALGLSLGILASINGSLRFVRPVQITQLSQRIDGLNAQTKTLQQDIQGLQTRLTNLEALSGRISAVEKQSSLLTDEMDKTTSQVETLSSDVSELSTIVQTLQSQVGEFQTFLNGLRDLLDGMNSP
jgi:hypothetical protein